MMMEVRKVSLELENVKNMNITLQQQANELRHQNE